MNLRVEIRQPTSSDGLPFIAAVRRSHSLHKGWIQPKPQTPREYKCYLKRICSSQNRGFLVIERRTHGLVGAINLNHLKYGPYRSAALGYYAFEPFAGRGLMREGMQLVLSTAFVQLKPHRIEADIQPENRASIALIQKCGFLREGPLRGFMKIRGRWRDHERWAMLSTEFRKIKEAKLG